MKRRLIATCAALGLLIAGLTIAPTASGTILAPESCITIHENGGGGDWWTKCGFPVTNANLTGDIAGLGGTPLCNTSKWPVAGNDWNDCVSRVGAGLAAGWHACFYRDANYVNLVFDTWNTTGTDISGTTFNDAISSYRAKSGPC